VRVIVAEDGVLLREGLVRILSDDGWDVAAAVDSGPALVEAAIRLDPDVIVTDVRMPPTHTDEGIAAARQLRSRRAGTAVVLLSQHLEVARALDLFQDDPDGLGYLLKDRVLDIDAFLQAVRRVAGGGSAVDPEVVRILVGGGRHQNGPLGSLSQRENDVLSLMAEGLSNSGIGERLYLGLRTIETHIATIFTKLGLAIAPDEHRRVRAVLAYLNGQA
jgi:DNA-binding NarL/FixJ family response regulator